jgi:SAM-dependent methyltransferase
MPPAVCDLSSGCGDPVSLAQIFAGATVLDIGSGAGLDCILAAHAAGPAGRVIGVDPSPAMRKLAAGYVAGFGLSHVELVEGTAEQLPVDDATIDIVISNCVLCLSADPEAVWAEIGRVLRPGGRFTISDTVGEHAAESLNARVRCELGLSWFDYLRHFSANGLSAIHLHDAAYVRFRDDKLVLSATVSGSRGGSHPVWVQVFFPDDDREAAHDLTVGLARNLATKGISCGQELLALGEERCRNILSIVASERRGSNLDLEEGDPHHVWIAADGRLVASSAPTSADIDEIGQRIASSVRGSPVTNGV